MPRGSSLPRLGRVRGGPRHFFGLANAYLSGRTIRPHAAAGGGWLVTGHRRGHDEREPSEGTGKGILGKAKEALGNLTGNDDQAAEGRANQAEGNVQQGVGGVQKGIGDALGRTGGQEQAAGQGDQVVGGLKEKAGNVTGNQDLQAEGTAQQGTGTAKEGLGNVKEGAEKLLGRER